MRKFVCGGCLALLLATMVLLPTAGQATVDSVKTFSQYGSVILSTHGAVDGSGNVVFLTREATTIGSILSHAIDLILGRVTILGDVFAIRPSFIANLSGSGVAKLGIQVD